MNEKNIFVYIAPSFAFFDNIIPLIYGLKRLNYRVTAILRDQYTLVFVSKNKTYENLIKLFDQVIYYPNQYMQSSINIPHRTIVRFFLLRHIYYLLAYIVLKLSPAHKNKLLFTKNPIFFLDKLCSNFDIEKSVLIADISFLQNKSSTSISKLKGSRVISIPHGIEFASKIGNQDLRFGNSEITELYFSDLNLYHSAEKEVRVIGVPRHNFAWRNIFRENYDSSRTFSKNDIVVFSDKDDTFAHGEKTRLFYDIFITAKKLNKNVFISPHPKEFLFVNIHKAAKKANFKDWKLDNFSPLSVGNDVFAAITFGSSIDWDLAFYGLPAIILMRGGRGGVFIEDYRDKNYFYVVDNLEKLERVLVSLGDNRSRSLIISNLEKGYEKNFKGAKKSDTNEIISNLFS